MTTPNKYADLRGEKAFKLWDHLYYERGKELAGDWDKAEAELAVKYPELTAAANAYEEAERINKITNTR